MGIFLLTVYLSSTHTWCGHEGQLHIEIADVGIALGAGHSNLYTIQPGNRAPPMSTGGILRTAQLVDQIEHRSIDGTVRRLLIADDGWQITNGERGVLHNLKIPSGVRRGWPPLLLGMDGPFAWFVSSAHMIRVDLTAERSQVRSSRMGRSSHDWLLVKAGERARVIDDDVVLDCDPSLKCERVLELPSSARSIAHSRHGLLVATAQSLIRIRGTEIETLSPLEPGVLCSHMTGTAWSAVQADGPTQLTRVGETVEHYSLIDLLMQALPNAAETNALAWADALLDVDWPSRVRIAERFSESESSTLRRVAALLWSGEQGTSALARLWLLGHDKDESVRLTAVLASGDWCKSNGKVPCRAVLAAFLNDQEIEVRWTARDLLLDIDPAAAIEGAPSEYRLEAVSKLSSRWSRKGETVVREILERMLSDSDPSVRAAAQMAVIAH